MSTKKIREMMKHYQSITNVEGVPRKVQLMDVIEEVDAIERAAKVMDAWNRDGQKRLDPEMARAWSLVESIAKDAP